jgi:hypothetical protein
VIPSWIPSLPRDEARGEAGRDTTTLVEPPPRLMPLSSTLGGRLPARGARQGFRASASAIVGVDGISVLLVPMTTLLTFISFCIRAEAHQNADRRLHDRVPASEVGMVGVFIISTVPLLHLLRVDARAHVLIIGIWGGPRRIYATLKL